MMTMLEKDHISKGSLMLQEAVASRRWYSNSFNFAILVSNSKSNLAGHSKVLIKLSSKNVGLISHHSSKSRYEASWLFKTKIFECVTNTYIQIKVPYLVTSFQINVKMGMPKDLTLAKHHWSLSFIKGYKAILDLSSSPYTISSIL